MKSVPTGIQQSTRFERLKQANEFIKIISDHGRRFFRFNSNIAKLKLINNRVWFVDDFTEKMIYTHYNGRWKKFSHGGTLKQFIINLKNYIMFNKQFKMLYKYPSWYPDPWAYGKDKKIIVDAGKQLGIIKE